jgi:two-component system CheB/CheR fusion protein
MLQKARNASYPHGVVKDVPLELARPLFLCAGRRLCPDPADPRHGAGLQPQFDQGPAVLACRSDLVPQSADLLQPQPAAAPDPVFHYALRQKGYLFLGSAENIAGRSDLFDTADSPAKVYRRAARNANR